MKLLYLKMKGFRKYKEPYELEFNDETYIIGGNAKGKSTIAYAVVWTFLGTDIRGNDKTSMINRDSRECATEIGFIGNDNKNHVLLRYKHRTYSSKNFILLDGKNVKQKDLEELYIDKPLFLSIFNPDYFRDCEPAKQKELIDKYLPDISYQEVFNKLPDSEKDKIDIKDGNITKFIKETGLRIRDTQNKLEVKKGNLEYAKKLHSEELEEKQEFTKQEEIDLLEQEKDFIETDNKNQLRRKLQDSIGTKEAEQFNIQNQLDKINEKGKKARIEYNKILSDPMSQCPCCNQPLNSDNKKIALENKRNEMFSLGTEKEELENKLSDIKVEAMQLKASLYSLGRKENSERLNEINNRLAELTEEKERIVKFNHGLQVKMDNKEKTKKDIINIVVEMEQLEELIDNYNLQIIIAKKLYCMIIQEKMKIVEQYMKNTQIKFYELIKSTGELKDCFKITRNGEEFSSLSKSQKFVTILEICNMLNKISGLNIPILIDDAESYPDFRFRFEDYGAQLIIIRAKKNRIIKISDKEESISSFRTIQLSHKVQNYRKIA